MENVYLNIKSWESVKGRYNHICKEHKTNKNYKWVKETWGYEASIKSNCRICSINDYQHSNQYNQQYEWCWVKYNSDEFDDNFCVFDSLSCVDQEWNKISAGTKNINRMMGV